MTIYIGILSVACYAVALLYCAKPATAGKVQVAAGAGVACHFVYIGLCTARVGGVDFGFFNMASIVSSVIVLLLVVNRRLAIAKLGIVVLPVAMLMVVLTLLVPYSSRILPGISWQMSVHIFSGVIAFSLLSIAACQAIFLSCQDMQLKRHPPNKIIAGLPPLQTMEYLLFQTISAGLLFLTVSLAGGFFFIDNLFAQHLAHKTLLSILAWFIFGALLCGRFLQGWRGQTAVQWTLIGFTMLLLAYFGSKLVLELILDR